MKSKLQQFSVKLLAATLAVIMTVPADVFAMNLKEDNSYAADTSVMGIQSQEDTTNTAESTDSSLIKSSLNTEETTDYIIEKSARLSKTTGDIDYKIVVKAKNPSTEPTGEQTTTFAIVENTDDEKLSVDDVKALNADGNETDIKFDQHTPNLLNAKEDIRTTGITSAKPQYGMVYYLSTKLTEEALKNLEEKSPQLALDFTIASPNQNPVQTRYSLETTNPDTTEITIDNDNNVVNQAAELVEKEDNLHLYKGEYKKEEKTLFQTTPAHLVWTDYINAKDDKEFAIDFDLDENQDTENSQIKIDYYEAKDKGYVLNQSFSKTVDFTNSLNLTIPQGYIAKISLTTAIKENTNAKAYTFNGVKVANPSYKEEKTEKTEEEQASDDADPLPDTSSKNDEEAKPSNDSITDRKDQDLSKNPNDESTTEAAPQVSAIDLNKDAYIDSLANDKDAANITKATKQIEFVLESYNKEDINWDDFVASVQNIAKAQNIDQAQTEDILSGLTAGLNKDKYKVANIDIKEAAGSPYSISINQAMPQAPIDTAGTNFTYEKNANGTDKVYDSLSYSNGKMRFSDYITAFCVNLALPNPFEVKDSRKFYQKAIVNPGPELFGKYAFPKGTSDNIDNRDNVQMYYDIKRAMYLIENKDSWDKDRKDRVFQATLARIIDVYTADQFRVSENSKEIDPSVYKRNGRWGKQIAEGDAANSESKLYNEGTYGQNLSYKKYVDDIFFKIPSTKDITDTENYLSYEQLDRDVKIKLYHSFDTKTHNRATNVQNIITYEVNLKPVTGNFRIKKVNEDGEIIATGAKFILSKTENFVDGPFIGSNGKSVANKNDAIAITSDKGSVEYSNLKLGTYYLKEYEAPSRYKTSNNIWKVEINKDGAEISFYKNNDINSSAQLRHEIDNENSTLTVANESEKLPKVELKKIGPSLSNSSQFVNLSGGKFILEIEKDGRFVSTLQEVPAINGIITFKNLKDGKYRINEVEAPLGYRADGYVKYFEIVNGEVKLSDNNVIENDTNGIHKIKVFKKDENGNQIPQSGIEFSITKKGENRPFSTKATNDQGVAIFDKLNIGKYIIKEVKAPEGYEIDLNEYEVELGKYSVPENVAGKDVSSNLKFSSKSILPIKASDRINADKYNDDIIFPNNGETLRANFTINLIDNKKEVNAGDTFYLKLNEVVDLDGIGLASDNINKGRFNIYDGDLIVAKGEYIDKRTIKYTFTDYVNNKILSDINITFPLYIDRYKVPSNSINKEIKVSIGGYNNGVFNRNDSWSKSISVDYTKYYNEAASRVNALHYKLAPQKDGNNFVHIAYLNGGNFNSREKKFWFKSSREIQNVNYSVYRLPSNYSLRPSYAIDTGNPLGNYQVSNNMGLTYWGGNKEPILRATTNMYNGDEIFFDLPYQLDNNLYVVVITGKVKVNIDESNRQTDITTWTGYRAKYADNNFYQYTWENHSYLYMGNASATVKPVEQKEIVKSIDIKNKKNKIEFTKSFVDSNGKNLDNDYNIKVVKSNGKLPNDADENTAYFKLTGKSASNKEIKIPDAIVNGKNIAWEKLLPGEYTLEELAPTGFEAPAEIKFTVNEGGTITQPTNTELLDNGCYQIANKKSSEGKFRILKVDENNKALSGAVFELTITENSDENPIEKTSVDGVIEYNGLKPGTYTLKEKNTLNGYVKTNQEWTVTVSNGVTSIKPVNSESYTAGSSLDDLNQLKSKGYLIIDENSNAEDPSVATIKVLNRKATYPSTGGSGTFIGFALIGTAIMLAGIAYYGIYVNDKNRRRPNR